MTIHDHSSSTDTAHQPPPPSPSHSSSTLFVGPFAHIRKSLDYNYHSNYTKERQWLQDSIIEDILGDVITRQLHPGGQRTKEENEICTVPTDPWLIFTAGVQGSGKFHTIRLLVQQGYLPLLGFIHVDSDRIRRMLPDFIPSSLMSTRNQHHAETPPTTIRQPGQFEHYGHCESSQIPATTTNTTPTTIQSVSTHNTSPSDREAGYIAEIVTLAALYAGKNVILDAAMKNIDWYQQLFSHLRTNFTTLRLALLHIIAPRDAVFQWSMKVAMETQRILPIEDLQQAMTEVPQAVQVLKQSVDFYCEILNVPLSADLSHSPPHLLLMDPHILKQSTPPGLETLRICTPGIDWNIFQTQFLQKCAWIPKKFKKNKREDPLLTTSSSSTSLTCLTLDQEMEASKDALLATFSPLRATFIQPFHVQLSTEDNYCTDDPTFYGPYAYLRKTLDYSYHRNYKRERQVLQDAIINDTMNTIELRDVNGDVCSTPTEPFLVFTAGAMGAGKSYTIHFLQRMGRFPLMAFARVDPDEIRRHLPEFQLYVDSNPATAGELTRKESGYIAEIMTLAALEAGKNVIVDGSLRDHEWYKVYFARLRQDYPLLKLAILHICAPRQAVFSRAADRALKTGRVVPLETLEMALQQVPLSVKILSPLVDYYCELWNSPDSDDIELRTPGITWDTFTNQWRQTCAWIPRRKMSHAK